MVLVPLYSNAVAGENPSFPRPELEGRLRRALDAGSGVKMFGLRRIGKSTLRLCATEHLDASRRPYAYMATAIRRLRGLADPPKSTPKPRAASRRKEPKAKRSR